MSFLFKIHVVAWSCCSGFLKPMLCETLFSAVSFSNIVKRNADILYYLLFLEEYTVHSNKVFLKTSLFLHRVVMFVFIFCV